MSMDALPTPLTQFCLLHVHVRITMTIVEILAATNLQVVQHSIPPRVCNFYISAGHRTACGVLTVRDVRVFASQKSRRKTSETIRINALLALPIRSRCIACCLAITFSLSTKIIVVPLTNTFILQVPPFDISILKKKAVPRSRKNERRKLLLQVNYYLLYF